ncbi:MAG: putative urea ABC transporter substrate-binding protein [Cellvibrio sp.]|uniref:putative urea ABC transporter substrate-binding protein n=1 Tax=Cellvibrio sp. TaxID=1965322 RepID=UPI0031A8F3C3
MLRFSKGARLVSLFLACVIYSGQSTAKETYKIAWTIYAGTMPLGYAQDHGILKKWGDKYGINLEAVQLNDYMEAQTQFSAGQFAGTVAITLDALTIPASSGIDTSVVIPLSTSVGSDGIIIRGKGKTVADLKGKSINLVELSGSHYMLVRALETAGLSEKDVKVVNTSDSDIGAIFSDKSAQVVATWKPQLSEILKQYPDTSLVFDSSNIRGEIVDGLIVKTATLKKEPNLGKAIAGAWFETVAMLSPTHANHKQFIEYMAEQLNTTDADLKSQLSTIEFFTPTTGVEYITSAAFKTKMQQISEFAFSHGLLGESAPSAEYIGIQAGDGAVIGNSKNVNLRFPQEWLKGVAQ